MEHHENPYASPSIAPGDPQTADSQTDQDYGQKMIGEMAGWQGWLMLLGSCCLLAGGGLSVLLLIVLTTRRGAPTGQEVLVLIVLVVMALLMFVFGRLVLSIRQKNRSYLGYQSSSRLDQLFHSLNSLWNFLGVTGVILAFIYACLVVRELILLSQLPS